MKSIVKNLLIVISMVYFLFVVCPANIKFIDIEKENHMLEIEETLAYIASTDTFKDVPTSLNRSGYNNLELYEAHVSVQKAKEEKEREEELRRKAEEEAKRKEEEEKFLTPNVEKALNIRKSNTTESDIVGSLYKGATAEIIGKKDGWYKITSGAVKGWVSADYVLVGTVAKEHVEELNTLTATVTTKVLNVRKDSSKSSTIIAEVKSGERFVITKKGKEWTKIRLTNKIEGYVFNDHIAIEDTVISAVSSDMLKTYANRVKEKQAELAKSSSGNTKSGSNSVSYKDWEINELAQLVMCEAGNQSFKTKKYVAQVVINRVRHKNFPNTIHGVIFDGKQFSPTFNGSWGRYKTTKECYDAVYAVLNSTYPITNALFFEACKNGSWHARALRMVESIGTVRFYTYK